MAIFDFFRKKRRKDPGDIPLEQSCYDIAYFILPQYVFQDLERLIEQCQHSSVAGAFFYVMACQGRGCEPDSNALKRFEWRTGAFDESRKYLLLSYPEPPPVDFGDTDPISMLQSGTNATLAPHFSLILYGSDNPEYYILGQSPFGGGTTLRQITEEGANCNLGPGPPPSIDAFFERVRGIDTETSSS